MRLLTFGSSLLLLLISTDLAFSQGQMSNDSYNLDSAQIDYESSVTKDISIPNKFMSSKSVVTSGFPMLKSTAPLKFFISTNFIDYGPLSPGEPVIRNNTIKISNGSSYGYSIVAIQDHPLKDYAHNQLIPDSTCDDGICNEINASKWINLTTFGSGYRCDSIKGTYCPSDFDDSSFYKHFASSGSAELAQPIIKSGSSQDETEFKITHKVNISASQKDSFYKNTINILAIPFF